MTNESVQIESTDSDRISQRKPKLPFLLVGVVILFACAGGGIWMYNQITLQKPMQRVLLSDSRNAGIRVNVHFNHWIDNGVVVYDLRSVSAQSSQMDVFRVLLQYADAQKNHRYQRVALAAFGQPRLVIQGDYFQTVGQEYETQNPVYTIRTFAHHVQSLDGAYPWPEPDGGLFWVLEQEMDQFGQLNKTWYLNDVAGRMH
jgi:hypothetical protein